MLQIICSIFREACAIENSEPVKALKCGHVFHTNCIATWAYMENIALIGDPTISDVDSEEGLSRSSSKRLLCSLIMKYRKVSSRLEELSELNNIFRNQLEEPDKIIRLYQRQFLDSRSLMISDLDPSSNVDQQVTEGSMRFFPAGPSSENIPPIEVSSIGNSYSDIHHQASSSSQAPTFQHPRRKRRSSPISPETRNNYRTHRHNFASRPRQLVMPHVTILLDNRSPELKEY